MKLKLGQQVTDIVTGFSGIIVARVEYISGCVQYALRPKSKDGKMLDSAYIDEDRLEIVDDGVSAKFVKSAKRDGCDSPPRDIRFD